MFLLGTVSAQAVPRFFVEANAFPFDPANAFVLRAGAMTAKRQLFAGYLHVSADPDVNHSAVYWEGTEQFLIGGHWFTTGNPLVVVVPSFGGGLSLGNVKNTFWIRNQDGYHRGEIDRSIAYGFFLDAELKFRIKPTKVTLSTGFHINATNTHYETRDGDFSTSEFSSSLAHLLLVGASYTF